MSKTTKTEYLVRVRGVGRRWSTVFHGPSRRNMNYVYKRHLEYGHSVQKAQLTTTVKRRVIK